MEVWEELLNWLQTTRSVDEREFLQSSMKENSMNCSQPRFVCEKKARLKMERFKVGFNFEALSITSTIELEVIKSLLVRSIT